MCLQRKYSGKVLLTASQSDANSGVAQREHTRTVPQGEKKRESQPRHELEIGWANFSLQSRTHSRAKWFLTTAFYLGMRDALIRWLFPNTNVLTERQAGLAWGVLYLHQHFAPRLSEPIYLCGLHSPEYFGSQDQTNAMGWEHQEQQQLRRWQLCHFAGNREEDGRTQTHIPPSGCLYSCRSKGGLASGPLCLQIPVQSPSFSAGGRGLFQAVTRYCSVQVYWGPLRWCRDPAEVDKYNFFLDVHSSYVSASFHTCLQILCSAVQHTSEGSPSSPHLTTGKAITPVLLGELHRDGS